MGSEWARKLSKDESILQSELQWMRSDLSAQKDSRDSKEEYETELLARLTTPNPMYFSTYIASSFLNIQKIQTILQ